MIYTCSGDPFFPYNMITEHLCAVGEYFCGAFLFATINDCTVQCDFSYISYGNTVSGDQLVVIFSLVSCSPFIVCILSTGKRNRICLFVLFYLLLSKDKYIQMNKNE